MRLLHSKFKYFRSSCLYRMDSQDLSLTDIFRSDMRMAAPGYTPRQKQIVKEQRKIEVESESESESEPEPAGPTVIDDRRESVRLLFT